MDQQRRALTAVAPLLLPLTIMQGDRQAQLNRTALCAAAVPFSTLVRFTVHNVCQARVAWLVFSVLNFSM